MPDVAGDDDQDLPWCREHAVYHLGTCEEWQAALDRLEALRGPERPVEQLSYVEDGFGSAWVRCGPACRLEVVRPGKAQCDCESTDDTPL